MMGALPATQIMPGIEDGIWCYMCGFEAVEQEQMDRHMKNKHASSTNFTAEQSHKKTPK